MESKDSKKWLSSMDDEMASLRKNQTWELVPLPEGVKPVDCKWLFKIKDGIQRMNHLKVLVWLKQSPRQWYKRFDAFMVSHEFMRNHTDEEVEYMKSVPYSSVVGSLMYAMVCTRPDLAFAVSVVSRFMSNPGKAHWEAVKWIMRYLKGSSSVCLVYGNGDVSSGLVGFTDSDHGGDLMKRRSLTCYIFTLFGCAISWRASLQPTVVLSTTEAEYMSLTEGVKEGMWLNGFLAAWVLNLSKPVIYCDSQSALCLAKNPVYHERDKTY
ncbi:Retrovirus-related Pol polyprotein from transposon TNT 1-94 [Vitis vinifera]|uniref:Retrovirus-related Pol polyprotein from transposon TNT 1-94 n=1 Tax=Vitis vinifera TaxID=29760 RepID=A0A438C435_VITVI|nr:Retrovirus-related Pol polyprotein from transposon TNT 1-94 [Vitis vinifera]